MLGLGFKQAKEEQVTGMNAFQDMLARLNGKTEEVEKKKEAQAAIQTSLYCDSKFGPMRFVRGGWLVGDQEQETPVAKLKAEQDAKPQTAENSLKAKTKKRKVEDVSDSDSSSEDEKARKKRRKEERKAAKKLKASKSGSSTPADETSASASASEKDKKKKSKSKKDSAAVTEDETDAKSKAKKKSKKSKKEADSTDSDAEKAAKKEKKRLKKEQKRAKDEASSTTTPAATGTSTPATAQSGASTPILRGHHAVRSKWIKSKSMATLDDAALNQVRCSSIFLLPWSLTSLTTDFHDQSPCGVSVHSCRVIKIPLDRSNY